MEIEGHPVGVLLLYFRRLDNFEDARRQIVDVVAGQVALAIRISHLNSLAKQVASREETEYLALELHDAVLRALSSDVLWQISAAKDFLRKGNTASAQKRLGVAERVLSYCSDECYDIMTLLQNHAVDDLGLAGALRQFNEKVIRPLGVQVELPLEDGSLDTFQARHLFRIAQAALRNVVAHAHTRRASVRLMDDGSQLRFEIEDDGQGFDPEQALKQDGHHGLRGIQKRAKLLGGNVSFNSRPGGPTIIRCIVPKHGGQHAWA